MRNANKTGIRALVGFVGLSFVGVANAQATWRDETVSISDPRPLANTAEVLVKRYGVPVSYEDVSAYTYEGDFSESREVQTTHWGARVLVPRGGSIKLTLPIPTLPAAPLTTAAVTGFLGTAAAQHEASDNPGRFKVVETLAGLAVVPAANRNSAGVLVQDRSLLDIRVSFPEMDRDIESALETFAVALRAATGKTINVRHGHPSMAVRIGANDEVARDVLAKMITSLRRTPGLGTESSDGTLGPPSKYTWTLTSEPAGDWPHDPVYSLFLDAVVMDRNVNKIPGKVFIFQCAVPERDCYNETGAPRADAERHVH